MVSRDRLAAGTGSRADRLRGHRRALQRLGAGRVLGRSWVLTISVHQQPVTLFPFTGLPAQPGGPGAEGSAVNVALSARSSDAAWLRAFHAVVPPLLARFWPQILVSQHGADTHRRDPLAHCQSAPARQR